MFLFWLTLPFLTKIKILFSLRRSSMRQGLNFNAQGGTSGEVFKMESIQNKRANILDTADLYKDFVLHDAQPTKSDLINKHDRCKLLNTFVDPLKGRK